MKALHSTEHQIATVWHPEPKAEIIHADHGNVRVLKGPAAYQLSSGQIIEIRGNQPA